MGTDYWFLIVKMNSHWWMFSYVMGSRVSRYIASTPNKIKSCIGRAIDVDDGTKLFCVTSYIL